MIKKEYVWEQKYRPQVVRDCILPKAIKDIFQGFVDGGDFPHLILSGSAGCGKTTIARALCNELDYKMMKINSSEENGIDVLRTKVTNFVTSKSLNGKKKVVLFDECERLGAETYQAALRGFIDEFSKNNIFIFTCNNHNKITAPIKSRCSHIVFDLKHIAKDEWKQMLLDFYKRCCFILEQEQIPYDKKSLFQYITIHYPDFRNSIVNLQAYAKGKGEIDVGILSATSFAELDISELAKILAERKYTKACEWATENESPDVYTQLMGLDKYVQTPGDAAELIITLGNYADMASRVADLELNLRACLMYLMTNVNFNG